MNSNYIFTYKNFGAVLNKYQYSFHTKDIVAGTIFSIENKFVLIDIGANQVAFLPMEEITLNRVDDPIALLQLNEVREFYILLFDSESEQILLSIRKVELIKAWKRIQQLYSENIILKAELLKQNKGGYIVQIENIKGFIPKSHLIILKDKTKESHLDIKILEYNENLNYLLMSEKCAYIQKKSDIFKLGKILEGTIDSIQLYGLFINIHHIQGLLHISEITQTQKELEENFQMGLKIKVMIIHIDYQQGRITLSQQGI